MNSPLTPPKITYAVVFLNRILYTSSTIEDATQFIKDYVKQYPVSVKQHELSIWKKEVYFLN